MPRRRRPAVLLALALLVAGCDGGGKGGNNGDDRPASAPAGGAVPTTAAQEPEGWQVRAPVPTARQEVAAAVLDGSVWVLGGLDAAGVSSRVDVYDPARDRWERGPDLPVAVHHAMAATYRGEVVLIGGFADAPSNLYASPSDRVLALRNGTWVDLPRLARPRGAGAAAVVGESLVVMGGRDQSRLVAPTEAFDGTRWRDGQNIPVPRDHLAAVADDRYVYAVGGRLLASEATSGDTERYDPAADAWQPLPDLPTPRGGLGAALVGGRIVVLGGEDPARVFAEVEAFDTSSGQWSALPPMRTPRHGLAVSGVDGQVLALAGGIRPGLGPSDASESLG